MPKIFEFFDDIRRPATAWEICATLGYPQSSVSMLLRSMEAMGYLHHDRVRRSYRPSHRLALSGAWLRGPLAGKGPLQQAMEDLHKLTGHAVLLNQRHGLHGCYIHVVQADLTVGHVVVGTRRLVTATGSGHTLLSTLPDPAVRRAVLAINARHRVGKRPLKPADVLRRSPASGRKATSPPRASASKGRPPSPSRCRASARTSPWRSRSWGGPTPSPRRSGLSSTRSATLSPAS